jgi:predicted NAD/FAD-dependent oxidoreductase
MLSFDQPLDLPFDGAFVNDSPLSWIARNNSKPERGAKRESWVLHASQEWTSQFIEEEAEVVLTKLIEAFWQATGAAPRTLGYAASHRWRHAIPPEPLESRCLFDPELRIGACGDWCSGPRVEGAILSGMAMAGRVLGHAATRN